MFNALAVDGVPKTHPLSSFLLQELTALSVKEVKKTAPSQVPTMAFANKTTVMCNGTELIFSNATGSLLQLNLGVRGPI